MWTFNAENPLSHFLSGQSNVGQAVGGYTNEARLGSTLSQVSLTALRL